MLYYEQSLALLVFSACVCAFCLRAILEWAGPAHSRASCGTAGNKQINKKLITRFLGFLPRAATHIIKLRDSWKRPWMTHHHLNQTLLYKLFSHATIFHFQNICGGKCSIEECHLVTEKLFAASVFHDCPQYRSMLGSWTHPFKFMEGSRIHDYMWWMTTEPPGRNHRKQRQSMMKNNFCYFIC